MDVDSRDGAEYCPRNDSVNCPIPITPQIMMEIRMMDIDMKGENSQRKNFYQRRMRPMAFWDAKEAERKMIMSKHRRMSRC